MRRCVPQTVLECRISVCVAFCSACRCFSTYARADVIQKLYIDDNSDGGDVAFVGFGSTTIGLAGNVGICDRAKVIEHAHRLNNADGGMSVANHKSNVYKILKCALH